MARNRFGGEDDCEQTCARSPMLDGDSHCTESAIPGCTQAGSGEASFIDLCGKRREFTRSELICNSLPRHLGVGNRVAEPIHVTVAEWCPGVVVKQRHGEPPRGRSSSRQRRELRRRTGYRRPCGGPSPRAVVVEAIAQQQERQ